MKYKRKARSYPTCTVTGLVHITCLAQRCKLVFNAVFNAMRTLLDLSYKNLPVSKLYQNCYKHSEEVGQLIRRIWANLSTNQIALFSSCSHEAFGIENLHRAHKYRLFPYCYAHFFGNFTRYYFYNSRSTHWNGILKGKRYFPVYFDLSL